jgi:hypothetical protein
VTLRSAAPRVTAGIKRLLQPFRLPTLGQATTANTALKRAVLAVMPSTA